MAIGWWSFGNCQLAICHSAKVNSESSPIRKTDIRKSNIRQNKLYYTPEKRVERIFQLMDKVCFDYYENFMKFEFCHRSIPTNSISFQDGEMGAYQKKRFSKVQILLQLVTIFDKEVKKWYTIMQKIQLHMEWWWFDKNDSFLSQKFSLKAKMIPDKLSATTCLEGVLKASSRILFVPTQAKKIKRNFLENNC